MTLLSAPADGWRLALRRAGFIGSVASMVSSFIISRRARVESGSAAIGTNSTSHWLWGDRAHHHHGVSARYTGVGYAIHHASSIFWALIYDRFFPSRKGNTEATITSALTVAVVAAGADYLLTPPRLRPGFERHLTVPSIVLVYAGFGIGLAAGRYLWNRR